MLVGSPLRIWAARAIIFVGILLLGGAVAVILGHYVRVSMFAGMDRFLGLVFGIVRGIVIVGAFTIAVQALRMDEDSSWQRSRLMPYAIGVADALRGIVGENLERLEEETSRHHLRDLADVRHCRNRRNQRSQPTHL